MGKDKKKRKAERKGKAIQFHQNNKEIKAAFLEMQKRSKYNIPGNVAIPTIEEELLDIINDTTFSLVFEHYNNKTCGITDITTKNEAEKIVSIFKAISKSTPQNIKEIIRDTIKREEAESEYKDLFSNIPEDIDLIHEVQFSGAGRLFFFVVSGKRNFACVVSINPNHLH
jgi:hypothetical protein